MAKAGFVEGAVAITGLTELKNAMKQADAALPAELRLAFKDVAEMVVARTKSGMPRKSGKMAASVKPRASQTSAGIAAYGPRVPYGRYVDFGGGLPNVRGVQPGGHTGDTRRPFKAWGRYIYPTLYRMDADILDAAEDAIEKVLRKVEA